MPETNITVGYLTNGEYLFQDLISALFEFADEETPYAPDIYGPPNGNAGTEYEYTFNSVDSNDDDVKYYIDWGDDSSDTTAFSPSGTDVKVKHTWNENGDYTITAKAQDIHGAEGPEGTLTVTMPRNKHFSFNFNLLGWLFERFPLLEVFLRAMNLLR